jgi:hypothetical protein
MIFVRASVCGDKAAGLDAFTLVLPFDPKTAGAHFTSATDYDTGYSISRDATTSIVTITAPGAELGKTITLSR